MSKRLAARNLCSLLCHFSTPAHKIIDLRLGHFHAFCAEVCLELLLFESILLLPLIELPTLLPALFLQDCVLCCSKLTRLVLEAATAMPTPARFIQRFARSIQVSQLAVALGVRKAPDSSEVPLILLLLLCGTLLTFYCAHLLRHLPGHLPRH